MPRFEFLLLVGWAKRSVPTVSIPASNPAATSGGHASLCPPYEFLLPQPFEQRWNVDLVSLVVAGQGVHHDVDAGAEGEFTLARLAGHQRQHRLAIGTRRPSAGEIVRRDDDRGYAVAAACRTLVVFVLLLVGALQCLDPELARDEAAREVTQQEECLGEHVIARHRLQFGNIE